MSKRQDAKSFQFNKNTILLCIILYHCKFQQYVLDINLKPPGHVMKFAVLQVLCIPMAMKNTIKLFLEFLWDSQCHIIFLQGLSLIESRPIYLTSKGHVIPIHEKPSDNKSEYLICKSFDIFQFNSYVF